jgi:SAM-dependent methyltransferase
VTTETKQKSVLDVGAGPVRTPDFFDGWRIVTLDIDPLTNPDLLMDARDLERAVLGHSGSFVAEGDSMTVIDCEPFDAVYMSHTLEHFTREEALSILKSFRRILKPDGTVYLRVPDMGLVNAHLAQGKKLDDIAYLSPAGGITYRDVRDGYGPEIARGNDWYRHKAGYDAQSMSQLLAEAGYQKADIEMARFELTVVARFTP